MEAGRAYDPRDIVTPHAFQVDPALLGTPLATPKRRLVAVLIDLLLASILAKVGGVLIGFGVAIVFFRVATRRTLDHPLKRWARAGLTTVGAFVIFLTAVAVSKTGVDPDDADAEGVAALEFAEFARVSGDSLDYQRIVAAAMAVEQASADSAQMQEAIIALVDEAMPAAMDWSASSPDSLAPDERAGAAQMLHAYADAFAAADQSAVDSLQSRAETRVAGRRLQRMRQQIRQYEERVDALEDDTERLAEEAAHPGIRRILRTAAEDIGLTAGWMGLYFTLFLAWWNGQTPGKKLLGLQVQRLDGSSITLWNAFERFGGYAAGLATGLLGFAQVYWDANRQGIQDRIAGTVVIRKTKASYAPGV